MVKKNPSTYLKQKNMVKSSLGMIKKLSVEKLFLPMSIKLLQPRGATGDSVSVTNKTSYSEHTI